MTEKELFQKLKNRKHEKLYNNFNRKTQRQNHVFEKIEKKDLHFKLFFKNLMENISKSY